VNENLDIADLEVWPYLVVEEFLAVYCYAKVLIDCLECSGGT